MVQLEAPAGAVLVVLGVGDIGQPLQTGLGWSEGARLDDCGVRKRSLFVGRAAELEIARGGEWSQLDRHLGVFGFRPELHLLGLVGRLIHRHLDLAFLDLQIRLPKALLLLQLRRLGVGFIQNARRRPLRLIQDLIGLDRRHRGGRYRLGLLRLGGNHSLAGGDFILSEVRDGRFERDRLSSRILGWNLDLGFLRQGRDERASPLDFACFLIGPNHVRLGGADERCVRFKTGSRRRNELTLQAAHSLQL